MVASSPASRPLIRPKDSAGVHPHEIRARSLGPAGGIPPVPAHAVHARGVVFPGQQSAHQASGNIVDPHGHVRGGGQLEAHVGAGVEGVGHVGQQPGRAGGRQGHIADPAVGHLAQDPVVGVQDHTRDGTRHREVVILHPAVVLHPDSFAAQQRLQAQIDGHVENLAQLELLDPHLHVGASGDGIGVPVHLVVGMTGTIDPLLDEGCQIPPRGLLHHLLELLGGRAAVPVVLAVQPQPGEEVLVAQLAAQHVHHPAGFLVGQGIVEDVVEVLRIFHEDRAGPVIGGVGHLFPVGLRAVVHFLPVGLAPGGESFVQPDVAEIRAGDHIAPPLVGQLMGHQIRPVKFIGHAGQGLMLHASAPGEVGVAVFLFDEGVLPESLSKGRDHGHGGGVADGSLALVGGDDVVVHRHGRLAIQAGVLVAEDGVGMDGQAHQVGGYGITGPPVVGPLAGGGHRLLLQQSVGRHDQVVIDRHMQGHGVGLVRVQILAGPPVPGAVGLAEGPDQGRAAVAAPAEGIAGRGPGVGDGDADFFALVIGPIQVHGQQVVGMVVADLLPRTGGGADRHVLLQVQLHGAQGARQHDGLDGGDADQGLG